MSDTTEQPCIEFSPDRVSITMLLEFAGIEGSLRDAVIDVYEYVPDADASESTDDETAHFYGNRYQALSIAAESLLLALYYKPDLSVNDIHETFLASFAYGYIVPTLIATDAEAKEPPDEALNIRTGRIFSKHIDTVKDEALNGISVNRIFGALSTVIRGETVSNPLETILMQVVRRPRDNLKILT